VVIVIVPLFLIASDALMHRLSSTWWIWAWFPWTVGRFSWVLILNSMSFFSVFDSMLCTSVIMLLMFNFLL